MSSKRDEAQWRRDLVFGGGIAGKTFLDIGSCDGDLCLAALSSGASQAVGIELMPEHVAVARQRAAQTSLPATYHLGDFESAAPLGRFDVVACLNVLQHFFDPIHALRRMAGMTAGRLVIELPDPDKHWFPRLRRHLPLRYKKALPAITVPRPERMHEVAERAFLPNMAAMEVIFDRHMAGFEPVRIIRPNGGDSFWVIATKRRIRHLTVVTGPTKSGKSTFKNRLVDDPAFRASLGLPEFVTAQAETNELKRLPNGDLDHIVLHYDFMRPYDRAMGTFERDPAAELFRNAETLSIFTMMTPKARIRDQLATTKLNKKRMRLEAKLRHEVLYGLYDTPDFLADWYDRWFSFCDALDHPAKRHTIVRNDGEYSFFDGTAWRTIHAEHYQTSDAPGHG